jgi:hypothetical protein
MNNLTDRAMLINLTITTWNAHRYDKQVSTDIATAHGSSAGMGRYNKRLVGENAASIKLKVIVGDARQFHYTYTLPWATEGPRILPSAAFMTYANQMRVYTQEFNQAASEFVRDYQALKVQARNLLGQLYNEEDYPVDVADKFLFRWTVLPLPDAGDFRVHLASEEIEIIKSQITDEVQTATTGAMREVWQRLYEGVSKMSERLHIPDAVFRNSLVENLRGLCKLLPLLNLTNDAQLEALRVEIDQKLTYYDADDLRDDKVQRAKIAAAAADIQRRMASYMG